MKPPYTNKDCISSHHTATLDVGTWIKSNIVLTRRTGSGHTFQPAKPTNSNCWGNRDPCRMTFGLLGAPLLPFGMSCFFCSVKVFPDYSPHLGNCLSPGKQFSHKAIQP